MAKDASYLSYALNTMPIQFSHLVRAYEFWALVLLVVLQCYKVPIYRINVPILCTAVCAAIKKKEAVQIEIKKINKSLSAAQVGLQVCIYVQYSSFTFFNNMNVEQLYLWVLYLWVQWWICSWREVPGRQGLHNQNPVHCEHNPWQRKTKTINTEEILTMSIYTHTHISI